eukprot:3814588-Pleurochrysis_carterae.AAC.2
MRLGPFSGFVGSTARRFDALNPSFFRDGVRAEQMNCFACVATYSFCRARCSQERAEPAAARSSRAAKPR